MNLMLTNGHVLTILHSLNTHRDFSIPPGGNNVIKLRDRQAAP